VDSGLNVRVKNISSVSGGSITNAFVACNCYFAEKSESAKFEEVAGVLAEKIAFTGLLQMWQSWAWGISVAIVVVLLLFSAAAHTGFWLVGVLLNPALAVYSLHALVVALGLFAILVLLLWLRSRPIDRWMETIVPPNKTLGELSDRSVHHVFCATDLNFGLPFFFSTADKGRLFSALHGLSDGGDVKVIQAVRASAAFPPAIPPISLKVEKRWVRESSDETKDDPLRLWLTDGGAFNNFATDWHRLRRRVFRIQNKKTDYDVSEYVAWNRERYGQVQLVIDAAELSQGKSPPLLCVPIIGFVAYVFRTMNVMYGSTLAGRSSDSENTAVYRMTRHPNKWLGRRWEHFKEQFPPFDPRLDRDLHEVGALPLYVSHSTPFDYLATKWPSKGLYQDFPEEKWRKHNNHAAEKFGAYWPWKDTRLLKPKWQEVPTTFRKLGRDVTLKLIIEGYLKTREVLFCAFAYEGQKIPDRSRFTSLIPARHARSLLKLLRAGLTRSRTDSAPSAQRAS
jgi:hypothetical protein